MGKKLYLTDLDGTLLNRESTVSCRSRDIINSLINSGTMFTYATARSYNSAKIVTDGLSVKLPIIVFNGAFIYDISKDKNFFIWHAVWLLGQIYIIFESFLAGVWT